MNRKMEILKAYSGTLTCIVAGVIWFAIAIYLTNMDVLKMVTIYMLFIFLPSYFAPYVLTEDSEEDTEDEEIH